MLRVRTSFGGMTQGPALSTMYFQGSDQTSAQDAADAVGAFWTAARACYVTYGTATVLPEVYSIDPSNGEALNVFTVTGSTRSGLSASSALPVASQGLLRLNTGAFIGGRQVKGHIFIPGATEDLNDVGVPTATYKNTLETAAAALIADADSILEVWSKANG